jgi:hypothetical protein
MLLSSTMPPSRTPRLRPQEESRAGRGSDLLLEEEVSAALILGFLPAAEAGVAGPLVASLP